MHASSVYDNASVLWTLIGIKYVIGLNILSHFARNKIILLLKSASEVILFG